MKKLLLFLGMCIVLSSLALADANYTFTNATGTYYVNNYTTVGNTTWTVPPSVSSVQVLVIAGGGSGGGKGGANLSGAGGGAGGLLINYSYPVSAGQVINITVGAGGLGTTGTATGVGLNGNNSIFGNITTIGGGGGGAYNDVAGNNGGSGGGGGTDAGIGGTGTFRQGYNGGNVTSFASSYGSAGGAGAGANGGAGTGTAGGIGGYGLNYSIGGSVICYAGGGAGAVYDKTPATASCGGGVGGRGDASPSRAGNGTPNTGGGGGGSERVYYTGGNGGSGIVIIQYQITTTNTTTLVYPSNTTHYTNDNTNTSDNFNGSIIITSTLNVTCTLNDTRFTKTSPTLNTTHTWYNSTLPNGNYSISTNCTAPNQAFWFILDTIHPYINQSYPSYLNTTIQTTAIPLTLNITAYDTYLYQTNLTIFNSTGHSVYNNYSGIITSLNYTYVWNSSFNLTRDNYTILVEATDSHTDLAISSFKPIIDDKISEPKITYQSPKEWGNIGFSVKLISSNIIIDKITDTKTIDRHSPEFSFLAVTQDLKPLPKDTLNTFIFQIQSTKPLTYLPNSNYIGHFVATDGMKGIWYDSMFDGWEKSIINIIKIDDYTYYIEIQTTKTDLKFNSLGGLNYNSVSSKFTLNSPPSITSANYTIDNVAHTTTCYYVNATDLDGDAIGFYYNWYNNSVLTSYTSSILSNTIFKFNETWNCSITPYDIYINGTKKYSTAFYGNSTLIVNLYDLSTGFLLTTPLTITLTTLTKLYNYTFNGSYNITNMDNGIYNYKVVSTGYSNYVSSVDLGLNSTQIINIYLTNNSYNTVFTTFEKGSTTIITDAIIIVQKYVGLSLVTVATLTTDITGKALLYYLPSEPYYFQINKTGYITKTFTLNPIIFSTYDVQLEKIDSGYDDSDFNKVVLSHTTYFTQGLNAFTSLFYEPTGNFSYYNISVSYPSGVYTNSGTTGTGQTFNTNINIVGATNESTVNITVVYKLISGSVKQFKYKYHITSYQAGTFIANKDETYGMGILERVLIVTIFVILVAGVISYYGNPIAGGVVGIFIFGYFSYIGFISYYLLLIPIFTMIFIVVWRSTQ